MGDSFVARFSETGGKDVRSCSTILDCCSSIREAADNPIFDTLFKDSNDSVHGGNMATGILTVVHYKLRREIWGPHFLKCMRHDPLVSEILEGYSHQELENTQLNDVWIYLSLMLSGTGTTRERLYDRMWSCVPLIKTLICCKLNSRWHGLSDKDMISRIFPENMPLKPQALVDFMCCWKSSPFFSILWFISEISVDISKEDLSKCIEASDDIPSDVIQLYNKVVGDTYEKTLSKCVINDPIDRVDTYFRISFDYVHNGPEDTFVMYPALEPFSGDKSWMDSWDSTEIAEIENSANVRCSLRAGSRSVLIAGHRIYIGHMETLTMLNILGDSIGSVIIGDNKVPLYRDKHYKSALK